MAVSISTVWEVRTTGSDTNGGGFVTGASGTDFSQQDAAQISVTDGVTNGTTTITSATANFQASCVGNIVYVQGGTGGVVAGWYEIVSRTNATTIVVDRTTGLTAGTGVTLKVGGAFATVTKAAAVLAAGHTIWVKAGTYTQANINITTYTFWMFGYSSTRGDNGQPTLQPSVNSMSILSVANGSGLIANFLFALNGKTGITGFSRSGASSASLIIQNCKATSLTLGFDLFGGQCYEFQAINCTADSCTTGFNMSQGASMYACRTKNCTTGVIVGYNDGSNIVSCLITGGTVGIQLGAVTDASGGGSIIQSTIYGTSSHAIDIAGDAGGKVICNNVIYGIGGVGIRFQTSLSPTWLFGSLGYNAIGSCTGGARSGWTAQTGDVTLSADPFTNAAGDDFSLNNTAGGGTDCRGAGYQLGA